MTAPEATVAATAEGRVAVGSETAPEAAACNSAARRLEILSITPEPTAAERAAIVKAIEGLGPEIWPDSGAATTPAPSPRWRYSGRPWRRRHSYGGWR